MVMLRFSRKVRRILSCNAGFFLHRLQLAFGLRALDARPIPELSRLTRVSNKVLLEEVRPLKLLVFSHNLNREGASISLKELVCGLKSKNAIMPEVIAFADGPLRSCYEAQGISVEVRPSLLYRISTTKRLNNEVALLARRIKASAPDVVFANTLLNFPSILAAELAGVPSVWNPRESEPWNEYFRFLPSPVAQKALAAISLPKSVVFVAESTRKVWKDFEQVTNFKVIHNVLNLDRFAKSMIDDKATVRRLLEWNADEVVFLCVGTLCERKGQQDALRALEKIVDLLKVDVRVVFVGDSSEPYGQAQQRLAMRLKSADRVRIVFEASTENIQNYYLSADAFLLCSRVESFPRVILEALAFGLPIISTPVFGVVEQIPDAADALFYAPGDVVQLSERLLEVANDPMVRQRLINRAKARFAEMPSFDQMLQDYEGVLRDASKYTV